MTEIDVDGIRFSFDDTWEVIKWDDAPAYLDHIAKLQGQEHGTKAVDIVGLCEEVPYLFEVKDFRSPAIAIANLSRDLPLEIGLKARDTAAGLAGAVSRGSGGLPVEWLAAVAHSAVRIVAWIAEDTQRPGEPAHKRGARISQRRASIAQRVAWLIEGRRVRVEDPLREMSVAGVTARSLPGGGPARRVP